MMSCTNIAYMYTNADETHASFDNRIENEDSTFQVSYSCFAVFYAVTKINKSNVV